MTYSFIVYILFWIFSGILTLLTIHYVVFAIVGIFRKKTYPKAKTQHRYGCIIPARNEEKVVGNLIESIRKSHYDQSKLTIFVIAHNCTDKTAKVARSMGKDVIVYEYNNPKECTMGYAFRYLFSQIRQDYGIENYDGFFLFNADNIVSENFFEKMNDAFDSQGCKSIITSFRNSKNFGSNVISGLYGLAFTEGCRMESRGRSVCHCSTRVQGTGYVIPSSLVKDGWKYVTLTEDWEFTSDQILQGNKILFCDDAVFYDEQPTTIKVMLRQRLRWAKGHLLVFSLKGKDLWNNLFKPNQDKKIDKFSTWDILTNILPKGIISTVLVAIEILLLALSPLFTEDWQQIYLNWAIVTGIVFAASTLLSILYAAFIFFIERKRIQNVSWKKKILICLAWPLFLMVNMPLQVIAALKKDIGWKAIPHKDTTNFDTLKRNERFTSKPRVKTAKAMEL